MVRAGRSAFSQVTVSLLGALALAGCVMAPGSGGAPAVDGVTQQTAGPGQRVIERDVEAPNVFQVDEPGLWDGRPSLGGVWVAHPDVQDPERAMIRNVATGATVIGALFRRERENPGPRFQISSEAANALGILPGAPTEIAVTALRLQRVELELDPAPAPETAATETLAIAPATTPTAQAPVAAASAATPAGEAQGLVEIAEVDPPRRGLFGLFRHREPAPDTAIAQSTLAPVAGATTAAASAAAPVTEAAEPPRQRRTLRDLFRRRAPEPEADTTMIALPDAETPPPAAPAAPAQGPRIERPFVQIGIFSVETNAEGARTQMQRAGLSAEIRRGRVGENLFWRVVVGPAGTTAERAEIQRRVRDMGFADAYAVAR